MRTTLFLFLVWLQSSVALPSLQAASHSLFDGKTFAGWEGDTNQWWRIEKGNIVGGSLVRTIPENQFLATTRDYTNFVLKLEFRLTGTNGFINSGVQIRSQRVPKSSEMSGYQCDIGDPTWWGSIYDESRRNKLMAQSDMAALNKVLKRGDWNHYEIRAEGRRIRTFINGAQGVDYTEADASLPQWGKLGIQIHGGGKAEAHFRKLSIQELP
ncbi:MAG: DUF1080 domain-containing protein [Verrucomicrobiales bacterium]|nr:DUF1080 domain-containing protein [Verrucomicrobiales bacterium]